MPKWISFSHLMNYLAIIDLMHAHVHDMIENNAEEVVFLLEHEEVYTAGTGSKPEQLLNNFDIPVVYSGRGGKFTYHGPGQRVIYPMLNLASANRAKDIKLYIRKLEMWVINSLKILGVNAYTIDGMVGVWVNKDEKSAKICSIGIRVKKWITYHGIAINISNNLDRFSGIIPCGIHNCLVTSLNDLGINISINDFDSLLKQEFKKIL